MELGQKRKADADTNVEVQMQAKKWQKGLSVLTEYGINYEEPLSPMEIAGKRQERIETEREKQKNQLADNSDDPSNKLKKLKSLSFDGEMKNKEQDNSGVIHQPNGIMQNGLSDDNRQSNSRQSSPSEDIGGNNLINEKLPKHSEQMLPPSSGLNICAGDASLSGLDPNFESFGIFDNLSAFMQSIDSPSAIDYGNQITGSMSKFEKQFDVQSSLVENICSTTVTVPQNDVEHLMQQVADEAGLELLASAAASREQKWVLPTTSSDILSLFDRPSAAILKMRREVKLQKIKNLMGRGSSLNKSVPNFAGLKKIPVVNRDTPPNIIHDKSEWLINEDNLILQVIQEQGIPLSLTILMPGHTPNWDLVSDAVNSVSRVYRSARNCKARFENVIMLHEEGKMLYDSNLKKPTETKGIYKISSSMQPSRPYPGPSTNPDTIGFKVDAPAPSYKSVFGVNPAASNVPSGNTLPELPSVPNTVLPDLGGPDTNNEVDFDDLAKQFEELKKLK